MILLIIHISALATKNFNPLHHFLCLLVLLCLVYLILKKLLSSQFILNREIIYF